MTETKQEPKVEQEKEIKKVTPKATPEFMEKLILAIETVGAKLDNLSERQSTTELKIADMESPSEDAFKQEANKKDIDKAQEGRLLILTEGKEEPLDMKISSTVDALLGKDFGARVEMISGRDGYTFTVVIPPRVSLLGKSSRPIANKDGSYKRDGDGNIETEPYQVPDERSVPLPTLQSYEVVQAHCEQIRTNIVVTHNKLKKPLPAIGN